MNPTVVRPGQIWQDNDMRRKQRQIRIETVSGDYVLVQNLATKRVTRVRLSRFRPVNTGYKLIADIQPEVPEQAAA